MRAMESHLVFVVILQVYVVETVYSAALNISLELVAWSLRNKLNGQGWKDPPEIEYG